MLTWYKNRKMSTKLIIGFVIVAVIAAIVGIVAIFSFFTIGQADKELYEENVLGLDYAGNAGVYFQTISNNAYKALIFHGTETADTSIKKIENYCRQVDNYLRLYEEGIITETDRENYDTLEPIWEHYKEHLDEAIGYLQAGKVNEAQDLMMGEMGDIADSLQDAFDGLFEYNSNGGKDKFEQNRNLINKTVIIMAAVIVAGVAIALVLGAVIAGIINKPVTKMAEAAKLLAKGDVNASIDYVSNDEIGTLAKAFEEVIAATKEQAHVAEQLAEGDLTSYITVRSEKDLLGNSFVNLVEKLNQIFETILMAADQVASGSNLIADSSTSLSQGATEQASSIEQLTASIQEIAAQANENSKNAEVANKFAKDAKTNAIEGNAQMQEMLKAMADINESSNNINKIIKVIDDIAFQTNILALNAAVEAARAGAAGKGFAVVAEEVRNLAAKSANAVKETTELIEDSIKKVEVGTKLTNNTADALKKIVEQVEKAAELVSSIAVASAEQSSGVEQVNQGIMQISQVVQSNAATAEESAAASEELSSQASQLKETVGFVKLKRAIQNKVTEPKPERTPQANKALPSPNTGSDRILLDSGFGKY